MNNEAVRMPTVHNIFFIIALGEHLLPWKPALPSKANEPHPHRMTTGSIDYMLE